MRHRFLPLARVLIAGLPNALVAAAALLANGVQAQPIDGNPPSAALLPSQEARPSLWNSPAGGFDPLTGPRSNLGRDWVGSRSMAPDTPILVMAGHADAQNISGSGTSGEAVGRRGAAPMYPGISDELYWNMVIAIAVMEQGRARGLNIDYYQPPFRTIVNANSPDTNWSRGREHAAAGGYALEIHFDAYGRDGVGSGLIPPLVRPFSLVDESLAREFGGYPQRFRNVLGGPRRGIALLEIGKLEGTLEASLRDPATREQAVQTIAARVVRALEEGLGRQADAPAQTATSPLSSGSPRTALR